MVALIKLLEIKDIKYNYNSILKLQPTLPPMPKCFSEPAQLHQYLHYDLMKK
jgi:hypothetical protein